MNDKKWIIGQPDLKKATLLYQSLNISPIIAKLLVKRGYDTPDSAREFIQKDFGGFHSPFLLKDMERAVEIIINALDGKKKIMVWGDYDVDGVTSVTILTKYLKSLGADVEYYIPKRLNEGYGLNNEAVEAFAKRGGGLIITVDSGITATEEIDFAYSQGLEVIVTDHHECRSSIPNAGAVIDPKRPDCSYPFKELAGVGVVFKLLCAIEKTAKGLSHAQALKNIMNDYADIVAIGTIADVMPIKDENRLIVSSGLDAIVTTKNKGISALIEESGADSKSFKKRKISSATVGFVLSPRINAAGRIGDSRVAVDLFMAENEEDAAITAAKLGEINRERQAIEAVILEEALQKIEKEHDFENQPVIVLDSDKWHHGVIGIVSSRITEKYNRPSILISFKNEGKENEPDLGKGSSRSIKGLNMVAALEYCSSHLIKYGGHELAAGLSIKRSELCEFKRLINEYANANLTAENFTKSIDIDCLATSKDLTVEAACQLEMLEPFGLSNPVPLFAAKDMTISEIIPIGEGKHTKLILKKDGHSFTALCFGMSSIGFPFCIFDKVDIVFNLDINNFKNVKSLQLIIRDIRLCEAAQQYIDYKTEQYEYYCKNKNLPIDDMLIPRREDFKAVYINLLSLLSPEPTSVDISYLFRTISHKTGKRFDMHKLLIIIDIFCEKKLILRECNDLFPLNQTMSIPESSPDSKVNLESSEIYKDLKRRSKI